MPVSRLRVKYAGRYARGRGRPLRRGQAGGVVAPGAPTVSPHLRVVSREKALVPEPVSTGFACLRGWSLVADSVRQEWVLHRDRRDVRL